MFALIDQLQASGVTRKAFCTEQGINIHTFAYWVAKHKRAGSGDSAGGFVDVDISGTRPPETVTITYPNGVVINYTAEPALIGQLIHLA